MPLDREELRRYGRHLTLPEVGLAGQERLRASRVLVIGAGGLGSPITMYLAAAGVGCIGLVEFDRVELSNLQRQLLYDSDDVDRPKLEVAAERLRALNPHVEIVEHAERFEVDNALELVRSYDLVIDGTDNFPTRYLVNDACVLAGRPVVYGSIFRFEGQVSIFGAPDGPCYRCLYPEPPEPGAVPNCAEGGVIGVLPGVIGTLQATEAIKWLLGTGESLAGRLLLFDALEMRFRELRLRRDPDCPICGLRPTNIKLKPIAWGCAVEEEVTMQEIDVHELKRRLGDDDAPRLLDVRGAQEWEIARIEGATRIALDELPRRLDEIDKDARWVVYCHAGVRSAMAVAALREAGFTDVTNLRGGIDAWSIEVDPSVPRY